MKVADCGSSAGAAWRAKDGALILGRAKQVLRVTPKGEVTILADGFEEIFGVAQDARGRLYVSDWSRGEVVRLDGEKREVIAKGLQYPSGLAFDSKGRLYIKENGRMKNRDMIVRRLEADGKVTLFATIDSVSRWRKKKGEGAGQGRR
ncbi:MAG: hypothetical protein KDC38_10955 [Planctomycetes bacterium]|nr:hypothetical protein [Planctomycetota bacterium]